MKILIVEDSRLARVELRQQLLSINPGLVIEEAANIRDAQAKIQNTTFDLFLLDIEMPGGNGFELLDNVENFPTVIFVTAYDQYAIQSFEYGAVDYLLKPVTRQRLEQALQRVRAHTDASSLMSLDQQVFLKQEERCFFVRLQDILAFESIGNYCRVHINGATPMIYRSLSNLEAKLPEAYFFRSSRAWIINTEHIMSIDTSISQGLTVRLSNGLPIEISRRRSIEFKRRWSL